jgi:hypothetical protein
VVWRLYIAVSDTSTAFVYLITSLQIHSSPSCYSIISLRNSFYHRGSSDNMNRSPLNAHEIQELLATLGEIKRTLDSSPDSRPAELERIRNTITSSQDISPNGANRHWQIALVGTFQSVAFTNADDGMVPDIASWCLRQATTFVQQFPQDVEFLACESLQPLRSQLLIVDAVIGRNWLLRAQKALASIHRTESGSSSSEDLSSGQTNGVTDPFDERETRSNGADYVEARMLLLPATEYLARAVVAARAQGNIIGSILSTVRIFLQQYFRILTNFTRLLKLA